MQTQNFELKRLHKYCDNFPLAHQKIVAIFIQTRKQNQALREKE